MEKCKIFSIKNEIRFTRYASRIAFTLVELLILVAILGILAALALPTFQDHIEEARESAAKDNLRILRNAIEIYAGENNGVPPGYENNDQTQTPTFRKILQQLVGIHLSKIPKNPFNDTGHK